jgi:metallo-beta-lactamase family protein
LTDWIIQRRPIREALILTHGEEPQMNALKSALMEKGFADKDILIPNLDDQIALSADGTSILEPPQDQRMLPEALGGPDWHNDLTELVFELRDIFEQAADDKARAKVLRRIRRALKDDA